MIFAFFAVSLAVLIYTTCAFAMYKYFYEKTNSLFNK